MKARVLAIGDIHGCANALRGLLSVLAVQRSDTVVILGDVIDRGPDSRGVIDQLMELAGACRLVGVLGNHDEMLLNSAELGLAQQHWLSCGGQATIDSYGSDIEDVSEAHVQFLRGFLDYWETDDEIFVHGNVEPGVPMGDQIFPWLRCSRLTGDERPHASGKRVVCGHTVQLTGVPAILDGFVCIDTWACGGGWLTCLDVTNDLIYQASENEDLGGPISLSEIAIDFR